MAAYTKIAESDQPVITIDARNKISKIEDNVYGGFTE